MEALDPTLREALSGEAQSIKPSELLRYYFRLRGRHQPLNEAKLILVGRWGVGKTSIVNRLVHKRFDEDEKRLKAYRLLYVRYA